jgi:hypothetical protein
MKTKTTSGDVDTIAYGSVWWAFPVEDLHAVQALCYDQRRRFLTEASAIHVDLEPSE